MFKGKDIVKNAIQVEKVSWKIKPVFPNMETEDFEQDVEYFEERWTFTSCYVP